MGQATVSKLGWSKLLVCHGHTGIFQRSMHDLDLRFEQRPFIHITSSDQSLGSNKLGSTLGTRGMEGSRGKTNRPCAFGERHYSRL